MKKYLKIGGLIFIIISFILLFNKNSIINTQKCEIIGIELNGLIDAKGGNGTIAWAHLNNREKGFALMINKTIYKKGFSANYSYEIGDSVIKKTNSDKLIIKRGENIAIYQIDCDDYR